MIITRTRDEFKISCFKNGARQRSKISEMNDNDEFICLIYGRLNGWKSLVADATILGMIDKGKLSMLGKEMMFESNLVAPPEAAEHAGLRSRPLFKFFKINGKTIPIFFTTHKHFIENRKLLGQSLKSQFHHYCPELKGTDFSKMIAFISVPMNKNDLNYNGHMNVEVACPHGNQSDVRHLTFS